MTIQFKPIDRDSLVKLLEYQGFRVEEAAYENLGDLRARYANDIRHGNIAWVVRDPTSGNEVKRVVAYCLPDRPPPYPGIVKRSGSTFSGDVMVEDLGGLLVLRSDDDAIERINGV